MCEIFMFLYYILHYPVDQNETINEVSAVQNASLSSSISILTNLLRLTTDEYTDWFVKL